MALPASLSEAGELNWKGDQLRPELHPGQLGGLSPVPGVQEIWVAAPSSAGHSLCFPSTISSCFGPLLVHL